MSEITVELSELDADLWEVFKRGDAWVAHSEYMRVVTENAKLRLLVRDMYGFIERMDEECGDVTFSDCFDYCKHDTTDDGCCKTGECWYEQRMRELGVEVDA